jgi:hypothetical protein
MKLYGFFLASLFFCLSSAQSAESKIYHWVDAQGKSHFSDTASPETKAEEVNVRHQNLLLNEQTTQQHQMENELPLTIEGQSSKEAINYQASITSPKDDTAIRSNNGTLEIQVTTIPEKENTHKLQLFLDGKALGEPQISTTIRALNVDRGTHQAQVHLLDENGKLLTKTQIVTVHLQRATVNTAN